MRVSVSTCRIGRTPNLKEKFKHKNYDNMTIRERKEKRKEIYNNLISKNNILNIK